MKIGGTLMSLRIFQLLFFVVNLVFKHFYLSHGKILQKLISKELSSSFVLNVIPFLSTDLLVNASREGSPE